VQLAELQRLVNDFVNEMGWYGEGSDHQQTARSLAISLSLEAAEVLEHFQWHEEPRDRSEVAGELADVMHYLLQLAEVLDIDLEKAVLAKLEYNRTRKW